MVIAVDVDGVVADLHGAWVQWYNLMWEDTLTLDQITTWEIMNHVKPECAERIFEFIEDRKCYSVVHPIEGALEGVNALRDMGHRVVFATSANCHAAGQKAKWLERHGFLTLKYGTISPDYMEVHDKSLVRADWLIDDGVHNLKTFEGGKLLFDQPWNREAELLHRACSWKQVVGYFRF